MPSLFIVEQPIVRTLPQVTGGWRRPVGDVLKATKDSWQREPFVSGLPVPYNARLSKSDMEKIAVGLVPQAMEDKWFIYYEAPFVHLHRSWSGQPVYRIELAENADGVSVQQALRACHEDEQIDPAYESRLLEFLVSNLLLGEDKPFPTPADAAGLPEGVYQHAISGTGYRGVSVMSDRNFRYYDLVMVAFVTVLVCSNLIGPAKIATIDLPVFGSFVFGAGVLFFPISYIFGDVLTEVYGYARARKVIWAGFAALFFASIMAAIVVALPPASFWEHQAAYEIAFGNAWRIVGASMIAYFCGEFVNSYVLAKMKIWTQGRWLWTRTIGSTIFGEAVDSTLFYPLAFYNSGIIPNEALPQVMLAQFLLKTLVEVLFTPLTYKIVAFLKSAEGVDHYDRNTDFTPFSMKTD